MITEEMEDLTLIQGILSGNRAAQEIIYNKYKKIVRDFIKSKYKHTEYIDDDVSEIMIKVFLNLDKYDSTKSKFKSWVISISKNHMIDKWRCGEISVLTYSTEISQTNTFELNNNEQNLSNYYSSNTDFENASTINFISTKLSNEEYALLNMKYIQGYDYNEIGQEFNLTSSTVSNKVNYIKTKLKKDCGELINE
jgi:RNA polymerase sigma-70 factor (ECF subfamily)